MTNIAFNIHSSKPLGVFTPMAQAGQLEIKMAESGAGETHTFNHLNPLSSETYVVLQGDYSLRIGAPQQGKRVFAQTGDVFVVPKGTPHGDTMTRQGYRILLMETPPGASTFAKFCNLLDHARRKLFP